MDESLRSLRRQAVETGDICAIVKYIRESTRSGSGAVAAQEMFSFGVNSILHGRPFPQNGSETIRVISWIQALKKDITPIIDPGEFLLQSYLRHLQIRFETRDDNEVVFDINGIHFIIRPNNDLQYSVHLSLTSGLHYPEPEGCSACSYGEELAVGANCDRCNVVRTGSEDQLQLEFTTPQRLRTGDGVYFERLSIENVLRLIAAPPPENNLNQHGLNLSEREWISQLREYGCNLSVLNHREETRGYPQQETYRYSDCELVVSITAVPDKQYNAIIELEPNRSRVRVFHYYPNFGMPSAGQRIPNRREDYVYANSPYDVFRVLSFKLIMEKYLEAFTTIPRKRRKSMSEPQPQRAYLSRQVEDQHIVSLHWRPYDSRFAYTMKILNNFGECEGGFKIYLFKSDRHREWYNNDSALGVFNTPEEVLAYIQRRDNITRKKKKHPLSLEQLFALAKEIGAKHGYGPDAERGMKISLNTDESEGPAHVNFAGYMIRPTWRRYRAKGKLGVKIVPTYVVEAGHTSWGGREQPPEYEVSRVAFADLPEDAIQEVLDSIESERKQAEAEDAYFDDANEGIQ